MTDDLRSRLSFLVGFLLAIIPGSSAFTNQLTPRKAGNEVSRLSRQLCPTRTFTTRTSSSTILPMTVTSPFGEGQEAASAKPTDVSSMDGPLDLTWENVDMVLDTMRSYLIQDGGNVAIKEIDGPVVRLELQGACGTCPSSTQTLKMGLERGLREKIPEIQEVVQVMPEGPALCFEEVDVVLNGVRPFLQVAGGLINCEKISGESSVQPVITLKMEGASASLKSVKLEIQQRLQRHFMLAGLKVEWV